MKDIHKFSGRMGNEMFRHAYLYAQVRKGVIPDFYLQDPKYFEGYKDELHELFGDGIGYLEQVGVHVRRGKNPTNPDEPAYHENPFYVDLTKTDYYEKAMALFPNKDFLIFSDDIELCKEKFTGKNMQVMDRGNDVEDFNLLASCEGIIGANSSWSWWAAFLCPTPTAKIVFPSVERWYTDGIERTVCPKEWTRI